LFTAAAGHINPDASARWYCLLFRAHIIRQHKKTTGWERAHMRDRLGGKGERREGRESVCVCEREREMNREWQWGDCDGGRERREGERAKESKIESERARARETER
jgi:hypothetical protein